jgi:raffinose/stachyose/melibiose transport system substrate-binding protein
MRKILLKILIPVICILMVTCLSFIGCKATVATETTTAAATTASAAETTAAATTAAAETTAAAPVKLVIWWWGEQEAPGMENWLKETISMFTKDNPNVTIDEVLQTTDGLVPAVQSAIQTQSGPDIMTPWPGFDVVSNYQNYVPLKDIISPDVLSRQLITDLVSYKGDAYGIPIYGLVNGFLYNKQLFKQAGIANADSYKPANWDDFIDACTKLKAAGITPVTMGFKDLFAADWPYGGIGFQWATEQDVLACLEGTLKYTDPKMWGWLTPIYELGTKKFMNDDMMSLDLYQGGIENFTNGKAAMTYAPDSLINGAAEQKLGDNLGMFLWPAMGDSKYKDFVNMSNGGTWVVTKWSPNPTVAGKFIEFTRSAERMKALYDQTGMFSADSSFAPDSFKIKVKQDQWEIRKPGHYGPYLSVMWPWDVQSNGTYVAPANCFAGKNTPQEMAELVQTQIDTFRKTNPDKIATWHDWLSALNGFYK